MPHEQERPLKSSETRLSLLTLIFHSVRRVLPQLQLILGDRSSGYLAAFPSTNNSEMTSKLLVPPTRGQRESWPYCEATPTWELCTLTSVVPSQHAISEKDLLIY